MADLHSRIRTELDRRLAVAQAATQWDVQSVHVYMDGAAQVRLAARGLPALFPMSVLRGADAQYFRDHEPAAAILRYTRDLAVLERHRDCQKGGLHGHGHNTAAWCDVCWTVHPCPEVTLLVESLAIPTIPTTPKGDDET